MMQLFFITSVIFPCYLNSHTQTWKNFCNENTLHIFNAQVYVDLKHIVNKICNF